MTKDEIKNRVAALLLEELKRGEVGWYYISVADDTFHGGYVVRAYGPTDAHRLIHLLGWWLDGCSTQTVGPIDEELLARIPESQRWRKLSRHEAENLGEESACRT